ncbi:GntR family transcriptional regulator [Mycolicibacterium parafortuitum]|uniref:GntR family transcriptional regulator n=1 Tax=Mycolicibacterium parafortuitum TaxID=39692 RepID=A0A7I7UBZ1_MYCPF|nr:FCD domain-containing protein [Mycolicibacterium parafortuitum]PQD99668.1 FadR family transcriptional regulator [Mycobacterium sp. EPG1]BBY78413.1 GntR family transcriptional regulator [Mycolicibacterium parafortuitum]
MNPEAIAPRVDSRRAKLAGRAAEQIIADVIELGWPVGQVLGSESELLARYGVSRAVLREAIRLVEHQRVARMRRGTGGGLVIDEPDVDAVIGPAVIYLLRVGATLDEIFDTRIVLEELVAEVASQRVGETGIAAIRETLARESAGTISNFRLLHIQLAELTANPILELFVETFTRVANFHFNDAAALPKEFDREVGRAHDSIAKAIMTNNAGLARERMRRHLRAEAEFISRQPATVQHLDPAVALAGTLDDKRGEALARQIFTEIVRSGAEPGSFVGSEATLMSKYRASRAVVREATRILEYHQIAVTRRGPGGGLFVTEPDISALVDIIVIYLRRRGVTPAHLGELRTGLELAVVERAAARLRAGEHDAAAVEQALRAETEEGMALAFGHGTDFHSVLAGLTDNRALQLVHSVTMRVGWQFFTEVAADDPQVAAFSEGLTATVGPAHEGIADALLAGDTELAVMRMRAHMAATGP